jgi:hypothetical protein
MEINESSSDSQVEGDSLVERLRQQRREIAEEHVIELDIPGYGGDLFARYRLLDSKEIDNITTRAGRQYRDKGERLIAQICDTLILSCEEFFYRDNGKEIPVRTHHSVNSEVPVRYDRNLAAFMGFEEELPEPATARSVVLGVFGGNDIAAAAHNAQLAQWMMRMGREIDLELGEL